MAEEVDPILLIFTIVVFVVMLVTNFVFLAYYSHSQESEFGAHMATKAVLVSTNKLIPSL